MSSGVVMRSAYVEGEIRRYASVFSNTNDPTYPFDVQPSSLDPQSETKLLRARSEHAAGKGSGWETLHDFMKPPYAPPRTPVRSGSQKSNRLRASSATAMRS